MLQKNLTFPAFVTTSIGVSLAVVACKLGKISTLTMSYPLIIGPKKINLAFSLDWVSTSFAATVLIIAGAVLIYSQEYSKEEPHLPRFITLMIFFLTSSLVLIFSSNMFAVILGWDLLGISSFCLVIFYQNYLGVKAGLSTILSNRVGDATLLLAIAIAASLNSWETFALENSTPPLISGFLLATSTSTKSAQLPFSAWLPAASAAPTPVSSLVHSSTLVTAGVYLSLRFNFILNFTQIKMLITLTALLTSLSAGWAALHEWDLKKIIASSTLSQLGLMMFSSTLGNWEITYFHLLTHAYFKALMFLAGGYLIYLNLGNQDLRFLASAKIPLVPGISLLISTLALSGFPFLAGFYSKDLILETLFTTTGGLVGSLLFLISLSLSVLYSTRMIITLSTLTFNLPPSSSSPQLKLMETSSSSLACFTIISGTLLQWSFYLKPKTLLLPPTIKMFSLMILLVMSSLMIKMLTPKILFNSLHFNLTYHESLFLVPLSETILKFPLIWAGTQSRQDSTWMEEITNKILTKSSTQFALFLELLFWKRTPPLASGLILTFFLCFPNMLK